MVQKYANTTRLTDLPPQQQRIVRLVREALCDKEIAAQMNLAPRTVRAHLQILFRKVAVSTRIGLLLHFYELAERAE